MLNRLFSGGIGKALILGLLITTAYLSVDNRAKQARIDVAENQIRLQQQANQRLNAQLERANQQIFDYLAQTKALQEKVATLLQQKQEKTNAILHTLEKHKSWANSPVPDDVSRLFQQPENASRKAYSVALPDRKPVPSATGEH